MSFELTQDADLLEFRQAAARGDWNACREATGRLLSRLPLSHAVELVREEVACRLPAFERHQPGVSWPRQFIEGLGRRIKTAGDWDWPDMSDEFSGPGANSLIKAINSLWQASLILVEGAARIDALVDSLSGLVAADVDESWGSEHPEAWERWYQLTMTGEPHSEALRIRREIYLAPQSVQLREQAWLGIARRCEAALRHLAGTSRPEP